MPATHDTAVALVTGASSGIGRDLARLLAAGGHPLVLAARGVDAMEALAAELRATRGVDVHVIAADLADPAAPQRLADDLAARGMRAGVLVNNAGFGLHGPFAQADVVRQLALLQVNVVALTHLTRLLLPGMVARGSGRVLNVASTAAFLPGPLMAAYYASKAYVLSFSQAIGAELRGTGVTVTALCPGPTATDFHARARVRNTALFRANTMASMDVARIGYDAMMRGKPVAVAGMKNKALATLVRFAPRAVVLNVAKRLNASRPSV